VPLLNSRGHRDGQSAVLCVSQIDGSHKVVAGHMDISPQDPDWIGPEFEIRPHELKCLPGEKKVSFIYEDNLYVVPVPGASAK
jgi:hypothetical protein